MEKDVGNAAAVDGAACGEVCARTRRREERGEPEIDERGATLFGVEEHVCRPEVIVRDAVLVRKGDCCRGIAGNDADFFIEKTWRFVSRLARDSPGMRSSTMK